MSTCHLSAERVTLLHRRDQLQKTEQGFSGKLLLLLFIGHSSAAESWSEKEGRWVCVCVYVSSTHTMWGVCLKLVLFMIFGSSGPKIPEVLVFWECLIIIRHHLSFGRDDAWLDLWWFQLPSLSFLDVPQIFAEDIRTHPTPFWGFQTRWHI